MIQRVQTIYLFLAVLSAIITFFVPYANFYSGDVKLGEYAMFGVFNVQSDVLEMSSPFAFPAWVFGILAVLAPVAAILLFKNRPVQLRVARLTYLVNLSYWVYLIFAIDATADQVFTNADVLHNAGFYLPIIAAVFAFLGVRGIKKDEALVKSLDRIR